MFLDDALNSTDVTTSKKIISRLFGDDGIIRTIGATAVVTTHIRKSKHFAHCFLLLC